MLSEIKKIIQFQAEKLGYRIVPRNRDARTLLSYVEKLQATSVVDVGANVGLTCRRWLDVFPFAHVHAIEALERFRDSLDKVAEGSRGRMSIWQVAAADTSGETSFHVHRDHPSSSSMLESTSKSHELLPFTKSCEAISVQTVRLDDLFSRNNVDLGKCVFIKLDVQGAELRVLNGCSGFLKHVACVLCEVNLQELYQGQARFVDIITHLDGFGLKFAGIAEQVHTEKGRAIYLDAIFLRQDN